MAAILICALAVLSVRARLSGEFVRWRLAPRPGNGPPCVIQFQDLGSGAKCRRPGCAPRALTHGRRARMRWRRSSVSLFRAHGLEGANWSIGLVRARRLNKFASTRRACACREVRWKLERRSIWKMTFRAHALSTPLAWHCTHGLFLYAHRFACAQKELCK